MATTVDDPAPAAGVEGGPVIAADREEATLPVWCSAIMEGTLWVAILLAVFFSTAPSATAWAIDR